MQDNAKTLSLICVCLFPDNYKYNGSFWIFKWVKAL